MTDQMQAARDDLAFMRELVQAGEPGERARGGRIIAFGGFIFAGCSALNGAASLGLIPWPPSAFGWSWFVAMGLFLALLFTVIGRRDTPQSKTSKAAGMAWAALGSVIFTTVLSCLAANVATGDPAVWAVLPSVVFAVYGAGWTVSSVLSGRRWEAAVALGAFSAAVAIAFLSRSSWLYLAYAAGLVLLAGVPGLVMMRARRA